MHGFACIFADICQMPFFLTKVLTKAYLVSSLDKTSVLFKLISCGFVGQTKFVTFALDRRILMVWLNGKAFFV